MDRRSLLLGASALLLAGCARVEPSAPTPSPTPVGSPSAAGVGIGVEATATGTLLGALLVGAAAKLGTAAIAQPSPTEVISALQAGTFVATPVWASSTWAELSDDEELPQDVLTELAGLLEPKVSVLAPGLVDGGLVWMATAASGQKSLEDLSEWSQGKAAAVPAMAIERSDGLGALNAIYRTNFQALTLDDPVARATAVASGQAAIGAFRRSEYLGGVSLVELIDPDQMCVSDQLVLLVNSTYADASPQQVLAMNAVVQALTTDQVVALAGQVAQGTAVAEVAHGWLVSHQLG
ncbi:MAG: hypothetical protein LWW77_12575 [Propionibacteriales bacterium]|nr:hypothetical protein [Propionibacteriales bacterium]